MKELAIVVNDVGGVDFRPYTDENLSVMDWEDGTDYAVSTLTGGAICVEVNQWFTSFGQCQWIVSGLTKTQAVLAFHSMMPKAMGYYEENGKNV